MPVVSQPLNQTPMTSVNVADKGLVRHARQPLTEQLAARFAQRIRARLLAPGARLPSVRECAQQQGVSPATVVVAYDLLQAQGLVEARRQRGFFVRDHVAGALSSATATPPSALSVSQATLSTGTAFNATALIRGMFHEPSGRPQPGAGTLPPEWLETAFMPSALRKVASAAQASQASLRYGEPMGDSELRRALARRLGSVNLPVGPDRIITTLGATQALDIVSRTLLKAGDPVMVEEPGWAVEFARLAALGMRVLPVPRRADGPDLEVMARYCEEHAPKLFVSVSVFHNPTGYCLSPAAAHRVLQLAHRHGFHVVEDDTYGHIAPEHATRLSVLDGLQRSIYVSGFAKILAPDWRVGFMAAPQALVERLLDTKLLSTLTTPSLLERAMALCIEQGHLRRHADRIKMRLDAARARSVRLAQGAGCVFAAEPAGLFGWVDVGVDTETLALRMLDLGYLLAPGSLFHATRQPSTLMRINFATTQDAAFWDTLGPVRDAVAHGRSGV
jgi:DNA-binding transcriptional MocR family regulator